MSITKSIQTVKNISVQLFYEWQLRGEDFQLIDVREPDEYEAANLGGELIPLGGISEAVSRISREQVVIVQCRSGKRSATAIRELQEKFGFDNLYNLDGGILAYLEHIPAQDTPANVKRPA